MTHPIGRRSTLAFLSLSALVEARTQPTEKPLHASGINFVPPNGWSVNSEAGTEGVKLLCPQVDGGYDAYIFVEQLKLVEPETPGQFLSRFSTQRKNGTVGYKERKRVEGTNRQGVAYGLIEYFHRFKELPTVEWTVVMPKSRLSSVYFYACTTEATSARNLITFSSFLNSVSLSA